VARDMARDSDYQRRADECGTWSENAINPATRPLWKQMESFWLARARRAGAYRSPKELAGSLGRRESAPRPFRPPFKI
jgi:hypothetical protein